MPKPCPPGELASGWVLGPGVGWESESVAKEASNPSFCATCLAAGGWDLNIVSHPPKDVQRSCASLSVDREG